MSGTIAILSGDMVEDSSDLVWLLHVRSPEPVLYELTMPPTHLPGTLHSGDPVVVVGTRSGPDTIKVQTVTTVTQQTATMVVPRMLTTDVGMTAADVTATPADAVAQLAAATAAAAAAAAAAANAAGKKPQGDVWTAAAVAAAAASRVNNTRMVGDMPVLFMIVGICNSPPATSVQELERVLFGGPGSASLTLEGYYDECSRGRTAMNRANSMVVDGINLPCAFNGSYKYAAGSCLYRDAWGWHTLAQSTLLAARPGLDLGRFRHRVLVLPRGYTYEAGCPWIGLGTLGPVEKAADGSYISSMAWIQGETANSVMAFMHELGHNLYLHHANDSFGCEYCDWSSVMGGCCAVRCHNAPHNWQLGWGAPLAVLNSATLPAGVTLFFDLPSQHTSDVSVIWVQPDWLPAGRRDGSAALPVSYYLSYRIDSGKYDSDIPDVFLYATSVYFWDGLTQTTVRRTRYMASVFTGCLTYAAATA
ncbi:hypothetical protein GPECTOR_28g855 [Gonium pectorale]|uniref:Peptidase M11 gametolysin domain-containing protein n=1 Tax=Gonium pectorale TaxID=33097 RepID=A0A150GFS5_GONPE|nr:hypothetical protein GPECTOR_28g855 [Gonium pectorale]|eukprot:KXZ48445.1 hypothetical protein GPECTOR_28g855 [Gonium pectorale]